MAFLYCMYCLYLFQWFINLPLQFLPSFFSNYMSSFCVIEVNYFLVTSFYHFLFYALLTAYHDEIYGRLQDIYKWFVIILLILHGTFTDIT